MSNVAHAFKLGLGEDIKWRGSAKAEAIGYEGMILGETVLFFHVLLYKGLDRFADAGF